MPQFGYITEDQVKEFWGENEPEPGAFQSAMNKIGIGWITGNADKRRHEAEFQQFLDSKLALAKESGKFPKDKELTEDETKQAKGDFARIKIYEEEATEKAGELGEKAKAAAANTANPFSAAIEAGKDAYTTEKRKNESKAITEGRASYPVDSKDSK